MSKITKDDVNHIAKLARLALTKEEEETMAQEMSSILTYVEKLNELDTDGVEVTAHVTGMQNVYRDDADPYDPGLWTDKLLEQAPDQEKGFVKVKGTLNKS